MTTEKRLTKKQRTRLEAKVRRYLRDPVKRSPPLGSGLVKEAAANATEAAV